ncbi:MAG TPA: autotransporter-associated beta strand repeat-containing protein [Tepidisphaeraceae bacterium]|jgi:autotransporter-associated beta strand protein|nr:autotransporter-associated beta strand repeat-containing protein [Tepidisphaeraceae bacterium]
MARTGKGENMKRERIAVGTKALMLAAATAAGMCWAGQASANVTWSGGGGTGTAWLTAGNWAGTLPSTTDIAEFEAAGTGTPIGINLNGATNNGSKNEAIGEILLGSLSANRIVANSAGSVAGTLTINGVSDGTNINLLSNIAIGKTLTIQNGTGTAAMTTAFAVAGNINVTDATSAIMMTTAVTAVGPISTSGAGTLTMTGNTTFASGGINVTTGSYFFNNAVSTPSTLTGSITSSSGTTIGGSGTIAGTVTSSGTVQPGGTGSVGTFTTGALTLNGGSALTFDLGPSSHDMIAATGGLTLNGGVTVNLDNLGGLANGVFNLIDFTGGTFSGSESQFSVGSAPSGPSYQFHVVGSILQLTISNAAASLTWNGNVNGIWDVNTTANWTGSATKFNNGDVVTFADAPTTPNITVAAGGVQPGSMTFSNGATDYTIGGGSISGSGSLSKTGTGKLTLNAANSFTGATSVSAGTLVLGANGAIGGTSGLALSGGATLQFGVNQTLDRSISISGTGATIDTQNFNVTYSGASSGTGAITKAGTGTLVLTSTSGTTGTGAVALTAGKISVQATNPTNGVAGLGSGTVTLSSGTTYEVVGATVGLKSDGTPGASQTINVGDGATIQGITTGTAAPYSAVNGTIALPTSGTGHLIAPGAADKLVIGSTIRDNGSATSNTGVISVEGNGVVQIASGAVTRTGTSQYNGSWVVAMGSTGVLSIGPILPGGFGEILNALGFNAGTGGGGYNGITQPVTVTSGTIAFGADQSDQSSSNNGAPATNSFRSPLLLNGGNISSTGFDYASFDTTNGSVLSTTQAVTANLSADITTATGKTSSVLLYDPVAGAAAGPRSLNITSDPYLVAGVVPGTLHWGAGSTLAVNAGGTSSGVLTFSRNNDATNNAVTVGAGATLSIGTGATVAITSGNSGGDVGQDPLYDGTTAVNVVNAGTLNVTATNVTTIWYGYPTPNSTDLSTTTVTPGVKHVGSITGSGTTNVLTGETLAIVPGSATSIQSAVNIDSSSLLDLANNKLAINYTGASVASAVRAQLQTGYSAGTWTGTTGITTSTGAANSAQTTGIGYAEASLVVGVAGGAWYGVSVDGTSLLLKYTYFGDANLDGTVNADDYALIDRGFAKNLPAGTALWTDGDFNYDGVVNSADYMLADTAFGHLTGVLSPELLAERESQFGDAYVQQLVAAVPEPMSLGLISVGAIGLIGGRRRRAAK